MQILTRRLRARGLALSALALLSGPVLAQSTDGSTMKPGQGKTNTGAASSTGVGNSPIEGTGETGNGRVLNGTAGTGGNARPGTNDTSSQGKVETQ